MWCWEHRQEGSSVKSEELKEIAFFDVPLSIICKNLNYFLGFGTYMF